MSSLFAYFRLIEHDFEKFRLVVEYKQYVGEKEFCAIAFKTYFNGFENHYNINICIILTYI